MAPKHQSSVGHLLDTTLVETVVRIQHRAGIIVKGFPVMLQTLRIFRMQRPRQIVREPTEIRLVQVMKIAVETQQEVTTLNV